MMFCKRKFTTVFLPLFVLFAFIILGSLSGCAKIDKNEDTSSTLKSGNNLSAQSLADKLLEKSRVTQDKNSFYIKTHVVNAIGKRFDSETLFYKKGNKWRSEELLNTENTEGRNIKSIAIFDGDKLDYYGEVEDDNHLGTYLPHSLVVNYGMYEYSRYKKEYEHSKIEFYNKTLEEIISAYNFSFFTLNWYPDSRYITQQPTSFAAERKIPIDIVMPKDIVHDTINGYSCTWIKMNDYVSACISEDYGVAINWTAGWREWYGDTSEDMYITYEVVEIKNTDIDDYVVDDKVFELPNIKPEHIYGKY